MNIRILFYYFWTGLPDYR